MRAIAKYMLSLVTALLVGCAVPEPQIPLTKEQVLAALDRVMLEPTMTCEQLRDDFGLGDLQTVSNPAELGWSYQEGYVFTPDDQILRAWYIPAEAARGTVVISIGAVGSMACYLFTAQQFVQAGWSVVIYDYRGFGGSTGVPELGKLPLDLSSVVDWARAVSSRAKVTLMGISLGTIPSVAVAVERPDAVNGVILDSPVALGEEIKRFNFLTGYRADEIVALLDLDLQSEQIIGDMTAPLLILFGGVDLLTPPGHVKLLYDQAAGPKVLARFPGIDHARAVFYATDEYRQRLDSFMNAVWSKALSPEWEAEFGAGN